MKTLHFNAFEKSASVALIPAKGSASITPHDHDFIEIVYVLSGHALHVIDDVSQRISQGNIFIIPPGHAHCIRPLEAGADFEETFSILNIILDAAAAPANPLPFCGCVLDASKDPSLSLLLSLMVSEYESRASGFEKLLEDGLSMLFHLLYRLNACFSRASPPKEDIQNQYVIEAILYFTTHYADNLTLDAIAAHVGLSKGYLQRLFKAYTGQTISYAISSLRIQRSCNLLITTDLNVCEIASRVGFSDTNQFHIAFKNILGITPKKYRIQNSVRIERDHEVI